MRTTDIERALQRERKDLVAQLDAIDSMLEGLTAYRGATLNGSKTVAQATISKPKTTAKAKVKRGQPKIECPDCGKRYHRGPGMAAHRKATHGWTPELGIDPNTQPMPKPVEAQAFA